MPIRWRLTLWFAVILVTILAMSGIVLQESLQRYLSDHVDSTLRLNSARVHGTLHPQAIPDPLDYNVIHSRLPQINEFASPGIYIQLIDMSGKVVVKSDNLGEHELPVNPGLIRQGFEGHVAIGTVAATDGARVRIMVSPLYLREQVLLLEVAQSLNYMDAALSRARLALLASALFALALASVSGGFLVRRALYPVSQIAQTAVKIEGSSNLKQRVAYDGPMDEIGRLATTFDHMIEHLDRVFESQRDFVADASHELRGPLTVIRGNLDLLKRRLGEEDRRESLRAIEQETIRMAKTVDDLLLLAETEAGHSTQQQAVALRELLREELARAQTLARGRKIAADRQEDLTAQGDAQRLKQVLANLVDNAIKYTPEQGTITLSLYRDNGWARLEVSDTGIGIAPEHLPHIFDRFYRVDKARSRASGGTGLGLAIARSIVGQYGGKITVMSEPGKGSTFTVWLKL